MSANDRSLEDKVGFPSDHDRSLSDKGGSLAANDLVQSDNDRFLSDEGVSSVAEVGRLEEEVVPLLDEVGSVPACSQRLLVTITTQKSDFRVMISSGPMSISSSRSRGRAGGIDGRIAF